MKELKKDNLQSITFDVPNVRVVDAKCTFKQ